MSGELLTGENITINGFPGDFCWRSTLSKRRASSPSTPNGNEQVAAGFCAWIGVSDIQNAAAILRTAAFYGVPFLLVAKKGGFGLTPAFYRLASGATEYVRIIPVNNLSRTLLKLKERGLPILGFSEEGLPWDTLPPPHTDSPPPCLVLGAEGAGLSHAVQRCVDKLIQIPPQGPLDTLNVSVASALAMEKFWNPKRT